MRILLVLFTVLCFRQAVAQIPQVPQVPRALPGSVSPPLAARQMQLEKRRKTLLDDGASHNARCRKDATIDVQACATALKKLESERVMLRKDVDSLDDDIDAAIAAERKRLQAREQDLARQIDRDATAVRNLGFDRRARDFEAWGQLALDAQIEFQNIVSAQATSLLADKVKDGILSGVKADEAKINEWISTLARQDPPPAEIIKLLRHLASVPYDKRVKLATDAKYLATLIKDVAKTAPVVRWKDGLPVLLEIICDGLPSGTSTECKSFRATATVTAAALYNNATRRVADAEIDKLTELTEEQLWHLGRLNALLKQHVAERGQVLATLKELEQ